MLSSQGGESRRRLVIFSPLAKGGRRGVLRVPLRCARLGIQAIENRSTTASQERYPLFCRFCWQIQDQMPYAVVTFIAERPAKPGACHLKFRLGPLGDRGILFKVAAACVLPKICEYVIPGSQARGAPSPRLSSPMPPRWACAAVPTECLRWAVDPIELDRRSDVDFRDDGHVRRVEDRRILQVCPPLPSPAETGTMRRLSPRSNEDGTNQIAHVFDEELPAPPTGQPCRAVWTISASR